MAERRAQGFVPEEGATGWSDTWMISSQAHTRTACTVDELHRLPKVNAQVAQYFGEAPLRASRASHRR
jgi:putative spermidine/putrescine transport system substrate-binding protein